MLLCEIVPAQYLKAGGGGEAVLECPLARRPPAPSAARRLVFWISHWVGERSWGVSQVRTTSQHAAGRLGRQHVASAQVPSPLPTSDHQSAPCPFPRWEAA